MHIIMKAKQNECPFGYSAADWANMAMDALDRAGMDYNSQINVRLVLEGWLDQDGAGDFAMSACPACDYSHGPDTTHVVDQQQVCRHCLLVVRS